MNAEIAENKSRVVVYSVEGAVARMTLNRPEKRNALNDAVIAGIKEGLKTAWPRRERQGSCDLRRG